MERNYTVDVVGYCFLIALFFSGAMFSTYQAISTGADALDGWTLLCLLLWFITIQGLAAGPKRPDEVQAQKEIEIKKTEERMQRESLREEKYNRLVE